MEVDDIESVVVPGAFVAVLIEGWSKRPVIGKVLARIDEDKFCLHWWKGGYSKEWEPQLLKDGRPYTDTLPLNCIVCAGFEFTGKGKNKLSKQGRDTLKAEYMKVEKMSIENI